VATVQVRVCSLQCPAPVRPLLCVIVHVVIYDPPHLLLLAFCATGTRAWRCACRPGRALAEGADGAGTRCSSRPAVAVCQCSVAHPHHLPFSPVHLMLQARVAGASLDVIVGSAGGSTAAATAARCVLFSATPSPSCPVRVHGVFAHKLSPCLLVLYVRPGRLCRALSMSTRGPRWRARRWRRCRYGPFPCHIPDEWSPRRVCACCVARLITVSLVPSCCRAA
jgi:hypothetical protein